MPIKRLDTKDLPSYTILASESGSIFNTMAWIDLYGKNMEQYGVFDNDRKLVAAFYLYKTKMFGLTYYKTLLIHRISVCAIKTNPAIKPMH
jgi:hypothetical protein